MNWPENLREALIAEALSDVAQLLDRVDSLSIALTVAEQALVSSKADLAAQTALFQRHKATVVTVLPNKLIEQISVRTHAEAAKAMEGQTRAIPEAARTVFNAQVDQPVQRLTAALAAVLERADRPWTMWMTHLATAVLASLATAALLLYLAAQ